ncbi:hypothetical protein GQ600_19164 [Phytophthora cactorum]|nr:hypothetical protein GQ600_19164 [Phytophthora cactorum]
MISRPPTAAGHELAMVCWSPHKDEYADAERGDDVAAESCRHSAQGRSSGVRDDLGPEHVDVVEGQQHTRHEPKHVRHVEKELVGLALAVAQLLHEGGDVERDDGELDHEEELQEIQVHAAASVRYTTNNVRGHDVVDDKDSPERNLPQYQHEQVEQKVAARCNNNTHQSLVSTREHYRDCYCHVQKEKSVVARCIGVSLVGSKSASHCCCMKL